MGAEATRRNFALTGLVRDRITQEALPFASVSVAFTKISTTANSDGKFSILNVPSDTSSLIISYLGYAKYVIKLSQVENTDPVVCELLPRERNLPSVEVSARVPDLVEIDKRPGHLTFNSAQISKLPSLGENDLFAALRRLPGIQGGQENTSGIRIRGSGSDQNLILFDGITVYHIDHFYGFLSTFNSNVVKNVQLYKSGFSAKYGGRTAGVVEIAGLDGNKVDPSLEVEANLLSANIRAELPLVKNKASIIFAYRRAFTDVIQSDLYKKMFNNIFNSSVPSSGASSADVFSDDRAPDFKYYDLNAKLHFKPTDKDAIALSYYAGEDDVNIRFDGSVEFLNRISDDDATWGTRGGSIKWSRKWGTRFFTYANYGISDYRSTLAADERFLVDGVLLSRRFFDQRTRVKDNTLRLDNSFQLSSKTRFDFGLWDSRYEILLQAQDQATIIQDSIQSSSLSAGYFEVSQQFGKLNLTGGLRASYYGIDAGYYFEPRLSFDYRYSEKLMLKGSAGRFYQFIRRLNERSLFLNVSETWTLASDATVPVLSLNHYTAGFLYQMGSWQIDVEAYYKEESGTVAYLFPEFALTNGDLADFEVDGNQRISGVDFLAKRSFKNHRVIIGYSFVSAESRFAGQNGGNYFRSASALPHELNMVYNFEFKRWDFGAAFVLSSGAAYTPVTGTFVVTLPNGETQQFVSVGELNSVRLEPFHRLDINVGYTVPLKKGSVEIGASIYNVYDYLAIRYIDYFAIPEPGTDTYTIGQRDLLTLGFTPSFFIKLKL